MFPVSATLYQLLAEQLLARRAKREVDSAS
jgi:hypothetical protein